MRILHLISQTPDFTGSGKFVQQLIRQSAAKGHDNFLLAGAQSDFRLPKSFPDCFIEERNCIFVRFDDQDIQYHIPGMSDVMPYQSTIFSTLCDADLHVYKSVFKQKIQEAITRFKPDIVHTHHLWILSALVREIAPDIPMVTTCHGTCLRQHHLCPHISEQIRSDLEGIDQIFALSHEQKNKIVETLDVDPLKIDIVSGGFDQDCFYFEPRPFDGIVEMVYAGKLSSAKGLPWLLKTLKKIENLPFRLHIAGSSSGAEKENCLSLARALGDKCIYHGVLSHTDLGQLLRESHIFILPSFYEGVPLVLMEALACGCKLVATSLEGVKEIFANTDERLIQLIDLPELETIDQPFQKDEVALENQLAQLLERVVQELAAGVLPDFHAIEKTTAGYTWENIFLQIEKKYQALM